MTKRETFNAFVKANNRKVVLSAWENQQLDSNKPSVYVSAGNNQCVRVYCNGMYELKNIIDDLTLKTK